MQDWNPISLTDVTSSFQGFTIPKSELYAEIEKRGWEVQNVSHKGGRYVAKGKSSIGHTVEGNGPTDDTALGNLLMSIMRTEYIRPTVQRTAAWHEHYTKPGMLQNLADAYAAGPNYDPKAAPAWKELAEDSRKRADEVRKQIRVEVVDDPEPYANAHEMQEDIHKNRHFYVSRANSDHPIWSPEENVNFRIVHDVLGHAPAGANFDWCFAPDTLIRTLDGYRKISEIKPDDKVLSNDGSFNRVLKVWEREVVDEELYVIDTGSTTSAIKVTGEHPFYALGSTHPSKNTICSQGSCDSNKGIRNGKMRVSDPTRHHHLEWKNAESLSANDYLVTKTPSIHFDINTIKVPQIYHGNYRKGQVEFSLTEDFLWFIGIYLAEGSTNGSGAFKIDLHKDEVDYIDRVVRLMRGLGYTVSTSSDTGSNGVRVWVSSSVLWGWLPNWLGRGCENKAIPSEILNLPDSKLAHVIDGILCGDGWNGGNKLEQTSEILALQVAEYALRCDGTPSITTGMHKGRVNQKLRYYMHGADPLVEKRNRKDRKHGAWKVLNETLYKIRSVGREAYTGTVYNLQVENNPTYVVQNIVVHNCGETQACGKHLPLLSTNAQKALVTECLLQTAYAAHYRDFGPQKIFLSDDHVTPYQAIENKPGHQGVHPSQSLVGTSGPEIPTPDYEGFGVLPQGNIAPHHEDAIKTGPGYSPNYPGSSGFTSFGAKTTVPVDPNDGWESGVDPLPNNAYMWQKNQDGTPPLNIDATKDMAHNLATDWHTMDRDTAKQAVVNAVRAAILSPKQELKWNSVTYQDVHHVPVSVEDPKRFWDVLQVARERWNGARGHESRSHKGWYPAFVKFKQMLKAQMHKPDDEIHDIAERELMNMHIEEQEHIIREKPDTDLFDLERLSDVAIKRRLEVMTKTNYSPQMDHGQMKMFGAEGQPTLPLDLSPPNPAKYMMGFSGNAKNLAAIGKHADELTDAALEDVNSHNGTGHHFRAAILSMGVKGVGPKVASFAWLLLQPLTSQLGTIDRHMASFVGTDAKKSLKNRDYFKAERQLKAGRDAAGYGHVPLGQFQWALWDSKRTGNPQDHSALRPLNPVHHNDVTWEPSVRHDAEWQPPNWWNDTQGARDHVGKQFDEVIAPSFSADKIPFQRSSAMSPQIPYFINSEGEKVPGLGGQSIMNHMRQQFKNLSTQEIWKLPHEVGKH